MTTEVNLDKGKLLKFGLEIIGASSRSAKPRLVIHTEHYDVALKGDYDGATFSVQIPPLRGVLEAREYEAELQIAITDPKMDNGDRLFCPLKENLDFTESVHVKATAQAEAEPEVHISEVHVQEIKIPEDPLLQKIFQRIDDDVSSAKQHGKPVKPVSVEIKSSSFRKEHEKRKKRS